MKDRLRGIARRLRTILRRDSDEIRRAAITFAAGLGVLLAMQVPVVERSFLGGVDRAMLDAAFEVRADVVSGDADPVLLIDIDDRSLVGDPKPADGPVTAPRATTSRTMVAQLLEFVRTAPPESAPGVVIVDVDLATPTPEEPEGVALMRETLAAWAQTPTAPPLVIARQAFPPASLGLTGDIGVLPATPYDDIVTPAPNIFWGSVKMVSDIEGVIREFVPFECAVSGGEVQPLYSVVVLAYGFLEQGQLPPGSNIERWIERSKTWCSERPSEFIWHGERINYHISFEKDFETRVWPDLPEDWEGYQTCGRGDPAIFRRLSAIDVVDAGLDASRAILCGRAVIIGGTNTPASDWQQTPLEEMAGPVIIANALRGLQMSGGGLKQIHFSLQVLVLLVVSLAISLSFTATRKMRERFRHVKAVRRKRIDPLEGVQLIVLNPVVLNWTVALAAHFVGIGLLLISLDLSFWGYLSAPAIGAAITETIQEFADD